jgi:uncharacterized cupin superfamily protein
VSDPRPNVFADTFSIDRGPLRGEPVVRNAGGVALGGTLYELAPGGDVMPLHVHFGMEELAIVLSGRPTLRTLEGESELAPGDVVAFPRGRRGAHTLVNRTDEPVRYLMISNKVVPEVVEYPEQGTIGLVTKAPFEPLAPGEDPADILRLRFKRDDAIQ